MVKCLRPSAHDCTIVPSARTRAVQKRALALGPLSIPRVLDRLIQHRGLEIVTLFPSSVRFLADASVLSCDDVNALKESARVAFAGLGIWAETFSLGVHHVAVEQVLKSVRDCHSSCAI